MDPKFAERHDASGEGVADGARSQNDFAHSAGASMGRPSKRRVQGEEAQVPKEAGPDSEVPGERI